jgi:hypothetical protein
MSANAGWNKLNSAIHTLRERVDRTEDDWRDQVRRDFVEQYLEPLDGQVRATLRSIKQLEEVLRRVRRECGDARE